MVCDLTLGKDKWQAGWDAANTALSISISAMSRAGLLADEDSDAFDAVMDSFKLPKDSDEQKAVRRNAIRNATLIATQKPFETAQLALKLLKVLPGLAISGNANAVSDVGVAGLLASAACKGALFNVDINLDSLPEDMAADIRKEAPKIQDEARVLSREVMDAVRERI
jgi:formiminotetrahydrofolate cyclodeaminase